MVYFSEKFEFSAMHKLWNDKFSEQQNIDAFGKCANPTGHGHNYIIEVTVKKPIDDNNSSISDFEKTIEENFISTVDHKNLNADVERFKTKNPTVENIAALAWDSLIGKFKSTELTKITVWENDRTYCTYQE